MNLHNLYDADFCEWINKNAEFLKKGKLDEIDKENLIEELLSMGNSQRRELYSRLIVLMCHLLKWDFQPENRGKSWENTIREQQKQIVLLLKNSPSLKTKIPEYFSDCYKEAVDAAKEQTGLFKLPEDCPYSQEEVLTMKVDYYKH